MGEITAELVDTGEKRDARGRQVTPTERRARMVQEYRASGLAMAAFARREILKYATLAEWVAKAQRAGAPSRSVRFTELQVPFTVPSGPSGD